jgi:short-subunit dehydrogenase
MLGRDFSRIGDSSELLTDSRPSDKGALDILNIDILAQTNLTHYFILVFHKRFQVRLYTRSAIIDSSSQAALVGGAFTQVYGASKAFNKFLTIAES